MLADTLKYITGVLGLTAKLRSAINAVACLVGKIKGAMTGNLVRSKVNLEMEEALLKLETPKHYIRNRAKSGQDTRTSKRNTG